METDTLIKDIKNENTDAMNVLIDSYGKLIYSVLHSILSNEYDKAFIDECFDDVLLNIWYNIDCFDTERGNFKNWVISISKFKAIDYKRKNTKNCKDEDLDETYTDDYSIEKEIILNEEIDELVELINNLKEKDRIIFMEKYINDESVEHIAKSLDLSTAYIYNRISRGKRKLKELKEVNSHE